MWTRTNVRLTVYVWVCSATNLIIKTTQMIRYLEKCYCHSNFLRLFCLVNFIHMYYYYYYIIFINVISVYYTYIVESLLLLYRSTHINLQIKFIHKLYDLLFFHVLGTQNKHINFHRLYLFLHDMNCRWK